jgi:hypothetical protein
LLPEWAAFKYLFFPEKVTLDNLMTDMKVEKFELVDTLMMKAKAKKRELQVSVL